MLENYNSWVIVYVSYSNLNAYLFLLDFPTIDFSAIGLEQSESEFEKLVKYVLICCLLKVLRDN